MQCFGGKNISTDQLTTTVLMINMKEQSVEELGSLIFARAQHACAIISDSSFDFNTKKFVLVTGGLFNDSGAKDELFDLRVNSTIHVDIGADRFKPEALVYTLP